MSRQITPHKGGRTKQVIARVTPEVHQKLKQMAAAQNITMADWIALAVNHAWNSFNEDGDIIKRRKKR